MGPKVWPWITVVILLIIVIILIFRPCPPCPQPAPPSATEVGVTVELIVDQGCEPEKPALSRNGAANHIRWHNTTAAVRTITFTSQWPFFDPQVTISIPAGAYSMWYTLDPAKTINTSPYQVNPSLFGPQGTPDEPAVSAGD